MTNRTKRDSLKRKLAQAYLNLDKALMDISALMEVFENDHKDLSEGLEASVHLILQSQKVIETFSMVCWNTDAKSLVRYK